VRLARYRIRLARRALRAWAVAAGLALVTGLAITGALGAAERAKDRWLPTDPVLVANRTIAPGEALDDGNTTLAAIPSSQSSVGLLRSRPVGAVAAVTLYPGEPVRAGRLVGPGVAQPGTQLVAARLGDHAPPLVPGDRVDVIGVGGGSGAGVGVAGDGPVRATTGASVVSVSADRVVLAVAPADVPAVARAIADGDPVLAVSR
jgi:Flp pilus assembly protein CpaB